MRTNEKVEQPRIPGVLGGRGWGMHVKSSWHRLTAKTCHSPPLSTADMSDIQAANSLRLLTSVGPPLTPLSPWQARDRWPSVVTRPSLHRWSTYIQFASDRKTRPTVDDYDRPGRWWWMRCRTHSERFPMHWQTSGQIRWQTAQRRKYDSWGLGVGGNAVDLVGGIGIEFSLSCLVASWVAVSVGHAIWFLAFDLRQWLGNCYKLVFSVDREAYF